VDYAGAAMLIFSTAVLLVVPLLQPEPRADSIQANCIAVHMGVLGAAPIYFYILGIFWFIDWQSRREEGSRGVSWKSIVVAMLLTALVTYVAQALYFFVLIEVALLMLLLRTINWGIFFGVLISLSLVAGVFFVFGSHYRYDRIRFLWHALAKWEPDYQKLMVSSNLWIVWTLIALITIVWLSLMLLRSNPIFSKAIGIVLPVSILASLLLWNTFSIYLGSHGYFGGLTLLVAGAMLVANEKEWSKGMHAQSKDVDSNKKETVLDGWNGAQGVDL
jgi:hypothetical protein